MTLLMTISPASKVSDIAALFDSYAVTLTRRGKELQAGPLWYLKGGPSAAPAGQPAIDRALDLRMIRYEPPPDDSRQPETRWPFFVESPVYIVFSYGDQWWQYDFVPGKQYGDRAVAALPPAENLSPPVNGGSSEDTL